MSDFGQKERPFTQNSEKSTAVRKLQELLQFQEQAQKEPSIRLYRAITGAKSEANGSFAFAGTDVDQMRDRGVFFENGSIAQAQKLFRTETYNRKVEGVPVYLTPYEAMTWLEHKKFVQKPTIAVLTVPLTFLTDDESTVRLMKNFLTRRVADVEISSEQLLEHIEGKSPLKGEFFLGGRNTQLSKVPEEIRKYETLVQPQVLQSDGTIDFESGFEIFGEK